MTEEANETATPGGETVDKITDVGALQGLTKEKLLQQIMLRDAEPVADEFADDVEPIAALDQAMRSQFPPLKLGAGPRRQAMAAHTELNLAVMKHAATMERAMKAEREGKDGNPVLVPHPCIHVLTQFHTMMHNYVNELFHPPV